MVDQFGFYDFEEYHKNHPNVSPLEYYEYLTTHVSNFNPSNIRGIDNFGDLETIIKAKNTAPDLYKTYAYLYSNDKDKFESMFDDMRYEINNLEGQLRANDFLTHLGVADGDNDILEAAANELGITTEGLKDGLISFGEGLYYSVEALGTALGICKENRAMSAEEYKRMYILYALLSEEEKIGLGVLTKDENGNVTNANENSIIDYTKEYSGGGLLSGTYQVTQGIGNMLPSMAVSAAITYVCPVAGAATMGSIASSTLMGISAGGNAYHSAMVDGSSVFGAIMYGIATGASESISERILGGLPFLSDVKVTSWATYLQAMAKEGTQEMFQGVMDIMYQSALLGKDLPDDPAVFEDLLKQGFYGAVTAGIMQAPALATSRYGACLFKKLMKDNNVSVKEQQAAIQAMREADTHGILTDLSDDEIKLKYGEGILNYAEAIRIQNQSNVDIQTAMLMYQNNVSEEVATIMKKSNVSVEIAKQMNEYGVTAVAADIMLKYNNNMDPEVATIMADNNIENYDVAYNMFKYEVNQNTAEIMNEHHCSKEIAVTMDKYKVGYDVATKIVTEGITDEATIDILSKHQYATDTEISIMQEKGVDISEGITERYKNGELSAKDVIGLVNSFNLSDKSVQQLFNKLVGSKLASWLPNATSAKEVYINLLTACDEAGIDAKTLSKNIEIMKAMEDYYLDAMGGLNLDTGESVFETYRTHGITHVFDVLTESINAVKAMKDSGVKGIDLDTVMLSAIMHDTGMSGGQQLSLSVKDGKLLIETQSTQADAGTYRESHSFNSGVSIIENAYSLRSYGYSDAQIAEAALLAFAHSKSNSGLNPLAGNDAGWSFAIQALQKAADASGCDFDIAKALYDAGILSSTETKLSDNPITVKCPKGYETENGHIKTDENGKPIKDGSGGKVTGKVETYTFSDGVIDRLSYEALAVRIGDALTNNDHAIVNQYFGKISFDTTNYSNQYSTQQIINQMIKNGQIESANANSIVNTLLKTDDGLMFAAFAETQHSTPETSVTFEIEGKTKNDSQPFVLGENNQTYRVEASDNGVDVVVSVKDTEAVPYCTLFAIQERAGELTSKGVDIFTAASDGSELSLVIEIDKNASTNTKNLYQQYAKYYARDKRIKVKIVEK